MHDGLLHTAIPSFDYADLRRALEKLRQAEPLGDTPLRNLVCVRSHAEEGSPTPTPTALESALGELLTQLIEDNLRRLRRIERLPLSPPATRQDELEALRADFARGNTELEAWSALYYRYVRVDLSLRVQDMAHALNADTRHVRRRLAHGCRRLAGLVSRLERAAREANHRLWMRTRLPSLAPCLLFGRKTLLADLIAALSDPTATPAVGLIGPGGMGKTTLAHAAAWASIEQGAFLNVAWLTLSEPTAYRALLAGLALALGYPHWAEYEPDDLESALRVYLMQTPTLIVLEDLENLHDYPGMLGRLIGLAGTGRLMLTAQYYPPGEAPIQLLTIPPLARDDIASLISCHLRQRRIGRKAVRLDDEPINCIYEVIGGNPLAALLVAGQMNALPLEHILNNLENLQTADGVGLFERLFAPTWERLDADSRQAALACCLLPLDGGSWRAVQALTGLPSDALDRALAALVGVSLLDAVGEEPCYTMHPLLRRFVETRAACPPDDAHYRVLLERAAASPLQSAAPPGAQDEVAQALTVIHAQAATGGPLDALVALIAEVAPFVRRLGYWAAWEKLLAQAISRLRDGGEPEGLASALLEMGVTQHWLGRTDAAMASFQEAIELYGGRGDFVRQAEALIEIGKLYHESGQTALAYEAYQRAAASATRYESPSHFRQAAIGLAALALHNNRPDQALDLLHQALHTLKEGESPDCHLLTSLCAAHLQAGDPERALHYQTQALDLFKAAGDLPNQARALLRLGTVHVELSQFDSALACLQNCLALMQGLGDALGQARTLTNLGAVHQRREEPEAALSAWQEALTLQRQLQDQIGLAYTLYNLADLQWALGRREEAVASMAQSRALAGRLGLAALGERIAVHPMVTPPAQT